MTTWLVTGGAGYIGSHIVRVLQASGRDVVVLDDFSSGDERKVPAGVPVVRADVADRAAVAAALREHAVDGVIHMAAKKAAGESVHIPMHYYRENVVGMISLLEAMQEVGVRRIVYSSSAAVYGTPERNPITEDMPLAAESPYGETKVIGEWMCADQGVANGLSWVALRYFNVAGAGADDLGDPSINNLIPMVFRALSQGERPKVFGDDYPTPDGTCIRDYIHVADLAAAHVLALRHLEAGNPSGVFNCGYGHGYSVREIVESVKRVSGVDFPVVESGRRAGDPPALISDPSRIRATMAWVPRHDDIDAIALSAYAWEKGL